MKTKLSILFCTLFALTLTSCSSDKMDNEDNIVVDSKLIIGEWMASHHSKNPNYGDTADMWDFTFYADGTGSSRHIPTGSFRYEIKGDHIILRLINTESFEGQTVFEYEITSFSKDNMEWDEILDERWGNNSQYLRFHRK